MGSVARTGDAVFEGPDGARVFVDPKSLRLLDGIVLDYDTEPAEQGFIINNPHAPSTCGCGIVVQRLSEGRGTS